MWSSKPYGIAFDAGEKKQKTYHESHELTNITNFPRDSLQSQFIRVIRSFCGAPTIVSFVFKIPLQLSEIEWSCVLQLHTKCDRTIKLYHFLTTGHFSWRMENRYSEMNTHTFTVNFVRMRAKSCGELTAEIQIYSHVLVCSKRKVMIKHIEEIVEDACGKKTNVFGYGIWSHHIVFVKKYGGFLAEKYGADNEVVEIAALLHDYAGIKDYSLAKNHHLHSASEAEKLLKSLGYPEEKISAIKDCIMTHRASVSIKRKSVEAICLASADAMAHIDQIPSLLYLAFVQHKMSIDEGIAWVTEKLERSWKKLCPFAKEIIEGKYVAAKTLLSTGQLSNI